MQQVRSPLPRRFSYSIAIALGFGLVFGLARWARHDVRTIPNAMAEPIIDVRPDPGARWLQTRSGDTSRVELQEGTVSLRIQRRTHDGRIVIVVPDGEIEDFGTVLRVRVVEERTAEVNVEEGNVAIRIRGVPELRLGPGQSWTRVQAPSLELPPPETPTPSAEHDRIPVLDAPGAPSVKSRRGSTEGAPRVKHTAHPGEHADVDDTKSNQSHDAEDEAYLKVVNLARAGKVPEARALARDYLLRFPNGFRRLEMLDIVTARSEDQ